METTCPPLMPTDSIINRLADALALCAEIEYNVCNLDSAFLTIDALHYRAKYCGLFDAAIIIFGLAPVLHLTKYGYLVQIGSFEKLVPFTLGE